MELSHINEIIDCLPQERTLFHYFKDRYAFMLPGLARQHGHAPANFERLLQKPAVRQWFGQHGRIIDDAELLYHAWLPGGHDFVLSLDHWDGSDSWGQTCRKGHNLVLQMGLNQHHEQHYQRYLKPDNSRRYTPFLYCGHPVMHKGKQHHRFRNTLAWARIDLDFEHNEALIEEVQTDWIRGVGRLLTQIERYGERTRLLQNRWGFDAPVDQLQEYGEYIIREFGSLWSEAMLTAAIDFIVRELGISQVYYHEYHTGNQLKDCDAPRSLYSKLPRRLGFSQVQHAPRFLQQDRRFLKRYRKLSTPQWYYINFKPEAHYA